EAVVDPAGGLAVVSSDEQLPIQIELHVHFQGPAALDDEGPFFSRAEGDGSCDAVGLHGFDLVDASASQQIFGEDVVGGLRRGRKCQNQGAEKEGKFAHGELCLCSAAGTRHQKNGRCRTNRGQYTGRMACVPDFAPLLHCLSFRVSKPLSAATSALRQTPVMKLASAAT